MVRSRVLALLLAACLAVYVPFNVQGADAAGIEPAAADDALPGVALEDITDHSATVNDTLDPPPTAGTPDAWDIYSVYLAEGEQLVVTLEGAGADFDLRLWAPSTFDPYTPKTVYDFSEAGTSTETICYTACGKWGTGRYFVVVDASDTGAGAGSYTLRWNVSSRSDGNVPGVALTSNVVTGSVDVLWDRHDVYRLTAGAGGTLSATLTADDPGDTLRLQLFDGSGTPDVYAGSTPSQQVGSEAHVTWDLPGDRACYLAVSAEDSEDASYTLEWSYEGSGVPGEFLDGWDSTRTVDATQVFAVDLVWGERLSVSFDSGDAAAFTAKLFAPGVVDLAGGTPVLTDASVMSPDGMEYTVSEGGDGIYHLVLEPQVTGSAKPSLSIGPGLRRIYGATRYDTAAETCASAFPSGADVVVIASGLTFPDALSASGLAGAYGAPVLLAHRDYLPDATRDEIVRLGATRAFVVGGTGAVGAAVLDAVDALIPTTPVRLGGATRYDTAAAVAAQVQTRRGLLDTVTSTRIGFVARGDSFADALALSPLAWQEAAPVFLVKPTEIPAATASAITSLAPDLVMVAGATSAVSTTVADEVASLGPVVERAGGATRYGTAVAIVEWGLENTSAGWRYVGVATGEVFADALSGGAACGKLGGLMLLTRRTSLPPEPADALAARDETTRRGRVFGGSGAVSSDVFGLLGGYFDNATDG